MSWLAMSACRSLSQQRDGSGAINKQEPAGSWTVTALRGQLPPVLRLTSHPLLRMDSHP